MPLSKAVGLASVFHCDLDALMKTSDSNMQALTEKEQGLLNHFNRLDAEAQDIVMRLVKYLDSAHR